MREERNLIPQTNQIFVLRLQAFERTDRSLLIDQKIKECTNKYFKKNCNLIGYNAERWQGGGSQGKNKGASGAAVGRYCVQVLTKIWLSSH